MTLAWPTSVGGARALHRCASGHAPKPTPAKQRGADDDAEPVRSEQRAAPDVGESLTPGVDQRFHRRRAATRCGNARSQQRSTPCRTRKGNALQRGAEQMTAGVRESQANPGASGSGSKYGVRRQ